MRAWIYDRTFKSLTVKWYSQVLQRLNPGTRLLDIGIGTGSALVANSRLLRQKSIQVVGVDIDPDYVKAARRNVHKYRLEDHIQVALESIYQHRGGPYDAAYFAASFMLMPDPAAALRHVTELLTPDGLVFFTQTFQERRSPLVEKAKPLLKKVTTIDFGKVTYESDFMSVLNRAGVGVLVNEPMRRSHNQSFRLVIGRRLESPA